MHALRASAFSLMLGVLACDPQAAVDDDVASISARDAQAALDAGALLLDVRVKRPSAPELRRPRGALPTTRAMLKTERYPAGAALLVLRDDDANDDAAALLRRRGHEVFVVDGGVDAWFAAGLPFERDDRARPIAPVSPAAVADLQQAGAVVVDARSPSLFAAAHVPGARSIPLDGLAGAAAGLRGPVVVVGIDDDDSRSAATRLAAAGTADVRWLEGGFRAFAGAGHLISTENSSKKEVVR
ncbi:MAG: rhodanese-like domain-containing protein [Deltaproteobacteria bacterium]|nr:rhodanese-like domain-containing protein [Deltaproteobacteria bacterium]